MILGSILTWVLLCTPGWWFIGVLNVARQAEARLSTVDWELSLSILSS